MSEASNQSELSFIIGSSPSSPELPPIVEEKKEEVRSAEGYLILIITERVLQVHVFKFLSKAFIQLLTHTLCVFCRHFDLKVRWVRVLMELARLEIWRAPCDLLLSTALRFLRLKLRGKFF